MRGGYLLYIGWVTLVYSLFCRYLLFGSWCFCIYHLLAVRRWYLLDSRVNGVYSLQCRYVLVRSWC